MKILIKENIPYHNVKKYLPNSYVDLLPTNWRGESIVNLIVFPVDKNVITSRYMKKAQKRIKDKSAFTIYFAKRFTVDAKALVDDSEGRLFVLYDFDLTDEKWISIL